MIHSIVDCKPLPHLRLHSEATSSILVAVACQSSAHIATQARSLTLNSTRKLDRWSRRRSWFQTCPQFRSKKALIALTSASGNDSGRPADYMDKDHGVEDNKAVGPQSSSQKASGGSAEGQDALDKNSAMTTSATRKPLLEQLGNAFKMVQSSMSPWESVQKGAITAGKATPQNTSAEPRVSSPTTAAESILNDAAIKMEEIPSPHTDATVQASFYATGSSSGGDERPNDPQQQPEGLAKTGVAALGAAAAVSWQGLVDRVQKTIRGSSDDVGWLQRMSGLPPVTDRTERFATLLGRITNGVHTLPDSLVYLLVPGLFSNHGPLYFTDTKKHFSKLGLPCHIAKIHSEASVETNAKEIKDYVDELYWGTGKKVLLLGHSKGGVDAAAAIAKYWDSLEDKVAGLVLIQSPYGGSPVASDLLREGQLADTQSRLILQMAMKTLLQGDLTALDDLTYDKRKEFLAKYPLPSSVPCVCFHTEASRAPGVLATLTNIAHADLPWTSKDVQGVSEEEALKGKVPVAVPLAAVMAVCALHLEVRYGAASDGMVARKDAEVSGSVVVRPRRKLDHGWMVYAPVRKDPKEVDAAQMCEALLTLLLDSFPQVRENLGVNKAVADRVASAAKGGGNGAVEASAAAWGDPKSAQKHDENLSNT